MRRWIAALVFIVVLAQAIQQPFHRQQCIQQLTHTNNHKHCTHCQHLFDRLIAFGLFQEMDIVVTAQAICTEYPSLETQCFQCNVYESVRQFLLDGGLLPGHPQATWEPPTVSAFCSSVGFCGDDSEENHSFRQLNDNPSRLAKLFRKKKKKKNKKKKKTPVIDISEDQNVDETETKPVQTQEEMEVKSEETTETPNEVVEEPTEIPAEESKASESPEDNEESVESASPEDNEDPEEDIDLDVSVDDDGEDEVIELESIGEEDLEITDGYLYDLDQTTDWDEVELDLEYQELIEITSTLL